MGRKGKCLSTDYINIHKKLKWECEKGHVWSASANSIRRGSWCPTCSGNKKLTLFDLQKIAKDRGGKCLSTNYINSKTHLEWECSRGHQWFAAPQKIKSGTWCPYCSINRISKEINYT